MADPHIDEPVSLIKTPKQLAAVVLASFVVTVFGIILLVQFITGGLKIDRNSALMSEEAIASRLKPVGEVVVADATAASESRSGEAVYKSACGVCHEAGLLNSPRTGDAEAWRNRLAQGEKTLVTNAIQGIRQMPARGGNPDLTDIEVARAVVYMANRSGANLKQSAQPRQAVAVEAAAKSAAPARAPTPATDTAQSPAGEKVYNTACSMCHAQGLAGAPKTGDKTAWKPRLAQGMETLYASAIKGKNTMPPKGGAMSLPDADIKAAVDYLVARAK